MCLSRFNIRDPKVLIAPDYKLYEYVRLPVNGCRYGGGMEVSQSFPLILNECVGVCIVSVFAYNRHFIASLTKGKYSMKHAANKGENLFLFATQEKQRRREGLSRKRSEGGGASSEWVIWNVIARWDLRVLRYIYK